MASKFLCKEPVPRIFLFTDSLNIQKFRIIKIPKETGYKNNRFLKKIMYGNPVTAKSPGKSNRNRNIYFYTSLVYVNTLHGASTDQRSNPFDPVTSPVGRVK